MFNTAVSIALLLCCCLSGANSAVTVPFEKRANGVITQCTTPNTVALTFVRRSMFATSVFNSFPLLFYEADLKIFRLFSG